MKNRIISTMVALVLVISPIGITKAQTAAAASGGAASGITIGTAVALGIIGAALLASIGSDSDAAPAGIAVTAAAESSGTGTTTPAAEEEAAATTTTAAATTTTTAAATTTTTTATVTTTTTTN